MAKPQRRSILSILAKALLALGGIGFIGATAWWYMFFEQLLGQSVKEASECFYRTTMSCEVGNFVGTTFVEVPTYSPTVMWISVGVMGAGVLLLGTGSRGR